MKTLVMIIVTLLFCSACATLGVSVNTNGKQVRISTNASTSVILGN